MSPFLYKDDDELKYSQKSVCVGKRKISNKWKLPPVPSSAANAIRKEIPVNTLITNRAIRRVLKFIF